MTNYHAQISAVTLTITLCYPEEIVLKVKAENDAVRAALEAHPNHAAALVRVQDHPGVDALVDAQDWAAIRSEFQRAAKKIGFSLPDGNFPVDIFTGNHSVQLNVRPTRGLKP